MRINLTSSTSAHRQSFNLPTPQPGEIWEVNRRVQSPLELSSQEQQNLFSEVARRFLEGNSPPRYVMIVTEPQPSIETEQEWQIVSVMVLSGESHFLCDVDVLIPSAISGLGEDLLAETWHVLEMLACHLLQPVGKRLSREIYDLLLSVGDYYHELVDEPPAISAIKRKGLEIGAINTAQRPELQAFHEQEEAWSDVLSVPLAAYRTYLKTMKFTGAILDEALQLEREFVDVDLEGTRDWGVGRQEDSGVRPATLSLTGLVTSTPTESDSIAPVPRGPTPSQRVVLSGWFENIFEADWQEITTLLGLQGTKLAIATRSAENSDEVLCDPDEIAALIQQLSCQLDEHQRRRTAKRLGEIAFGDSQAIQALVNLLRTTQDDETLWTAVESLWQIDPGNPFAGVRRVKWVDLGMQVAGVAVALAVAIARKGERQVGVLLQVYPTDNQAYLPPDLKLILLDASGQILREVIARQADIYIQLKFSGQPGELFSVSVALGEASLTEDFLM